MATQEVTSPIALDETLQDTNTALGLLGKDTTLQSIVTALASLGINTIGSLASLVTADKTSLVGAVNELAGDIDDLDTDKADKVSGATSGNLAGLDANGSLTDAGWTSDKTTTSASGNPISISGLKSNQLAINPVITFEPIQAGSGTPSPSNVRAISGYDKIEVLSCGKNLFDGRYSESGKYLNQDGTLTNGSSWYVTNYIVVKGGTSYTLSHSSSTSNNGICWYDANMTYIDGALWGSATIKTITLPSNAKYIRASYYANWIPTFQIEEGSTSTTYEPYKSATSISESLGQMVYGGTLDVRTGVLTVTHKIVDMGDLSWDYSNGVFTANIAEGQKVTSAGEDSLFITDLYEVKESASSSGYSDENNVAWEGFTSANYMIFRSRDSRYTDATTYKTAMNGHQICYQLATPFTIQLTPHEISLLKDYAYVSTNGTSIALDYHNGEMASLSDVSQLGETVNEIGNVMLKHLRIVYQFGTTIVDTRYTYCITDDYPMINRNTVKSITIYTPSGATGFDYNGIIKPNYGSSIPNNLYINYIAKLAQNSAKVYIDILYLVTP